MCLVICVLNDQLLEWPGQFMETMKDSWIHTIDDIQVVILYVWNLHPTLKNIITCHLVKAKWHMNSNIFVNHLA